MMQTEEYENLAQLNLYKVGMQNAKKNTKRSNFDLSPKCFNKLPSEICVKVYLLSVFKLVVLLQLRGEVTP